MSRLSIGCLVPRRELDHRQHTRCDDRDRQRLRARPACRPCCSTVPAGRSSAIDRPSDASGRHRARQLGRLGEPLVAGVARVLASLLAVAEA